MSDQVADNPLPISATALLTRATLHSDLVETRCMALTRDGVRCRAHKVPNSDFCAIHANLASVTVDREHGRFIGYAGDLESNYQSSLQDKYLLHLRDEISILDARIKDLLPQARTGVNAAAWLVARKAHDRLTNAIATDDALGVKPALVEMQQAFNASRHDLDLWVDIERTMELRRKLTETEQKYLTQSNQMIPTETTMSLLSALITAIKRSVKKYVDSVELEEAIIADAQREYESLIGSR